MLIAMKLHRVFLLISILILSASLALAQSDENLEGVQIESTIAFRGTYKDSLTMPKVDSIIIDEKEPQIIYKKEPAPVLDADGSVIEGNVFLKLWVGADSVVKKVVLIRADNQNLVRSSFVAAMQYRFSPAMINGKPVDVWVTVPFKYRKK
jgi:hypothetical protein